MKNNQAVSLLIQDIYSKKEKTPILSWGFLVEAVLYQPIMPMTGIEPAR